MPPMFYSFTNDGDLRHLPIACHVLRLESRTKPAHA